MKYRLVVLVAILAATSLRSYASQSIDYQSLQMLMKSDINAARAVVSYGAYMSSRCGADMSINEISKNGRVHELSMAYKEGNEVEVKNILENQRCHIFSGLSKNLDLLKSKLASQQACIATEEKLKSLKLPDEAIKEKLVGKATVELLCNENKVFHTEVVQDMKKELEKASCGTYEQAAKLLVSESPFRKFKGNVCVSALSFIDDLEKNQNLKKEG